MRKYLMIKMLVGIILNTSSAYAEDNFTLGLVQKEVHTGMTQTQVVESLGSPNMVTGDGGGKETWVYDKIATEASYKSSNVGLSLGVGAGGAPTSSLVLGGVGLGIGSSKGHSQVSQKTLTVVLKFSKNKTLESFSYHSSKF